MTHVQVTIPNIDELTDNADRLLQQGLAEAALAAGIDPSNAPDVALARANTKILAFTQAVAIHGNYRYDRDVIAPNAIPTTARGTWLDMWLDAYGLPRKQATPAAGTVTGTGSAGRVLPAGSSVAIDELRYTTTADAVVQADGTLVATVLCDSAGLAGNRAAAVAASLVATVDGINSDLLVAEPGLAGGADQERDDEAIYRLRQRLANPPRGSSPTDYERWALSVPGITRAWGVRNPSGPTSAGVIILADNNEYGLPTEAQRQAVYDYIRDLDRGPPDELFVIIPEPVFIDVILEITPDSQTVRQAIEAELRDLFYREAVPGGRIEHTHLSEAVSIAAGEYTHQFIQPVLTPGGYLLAGQFQMLILRGVSFT